jgi:RHH-type proline utilization regulon transcriptional repressor/proline dehydrogenase/delta 1-pyrroline-5-carboxylate dehydrogenase
VDLSFAPPPGSSSTARAERVEELVRQWLAETLQEPVSPAARRLGEVLRDPEGLTFTAGFIDGVVRPEDARVAAHVLAGLAPSAPRFLSPGLRAALRVGGAVAPIAPQITMPVVERVLRRLVGHLIIDASDARLGPAIGRVRTEGVSLNINLLGEAVLGAEQADRRLAQTLALLARPDVDYVSVKVSAVISPHAPWAFDETVEAVAERLAPLMREARDKPGRGFVNLDMEEYRDLELTIAVFTRLLDRPEFVDLEAGIVLQAYLPDALAAMMRLQSWAAARVSAGGAPIKVRMVKGANLPMERVEASLHGWPLATWSSKQQTDTNYKRVLDWAMTPERVANVRLGVASHNLFDIADAWLTATDRGVTDRIQFEMLLGMAQAQAEVVRRTVGGLLLYTPVVHPEEFDVAIAYLVRRLEETASAENYLSGALEMAGDEAIFARERDRYRASLAPLDDTVPTRRRTQDRRIAPTPADQGRFANTEDTDPSLPANLQWARAILTSAAHSSRGEVEVQDATLDDAKQVEATIAAARTAAREWAALGVRGRSELLHRAGDALERDRGLLAEVMAAETGKTMSEADPEISEAIDFAHYYADQALGLEQIKGAVLEPATLTVVAPPWNFPVSIPAGSTLAALATGSSVILKPAPEAQRCAAVLAQALWSAGIPRDVLQLVVVDERALGGGLIGHPGVDRVILTGAFETAQRFRGFRADLPLLAETSGKNAIIVTPSADLDLAARDVVASAFGHAGQKCSAASLVILVGSVARSPRFRRQLVDATRSLNVGDAWHPETQMGPIIVPAGGKLQRGLTKLEPGQSWLLEPRSLSDDGRHWTPGIRDGVAPGSEFHRTEYFGPVLGIMSADTLEQAIAYQNEVDYGLTSGLHSLDRDEIGQWLEHVHAGNLYVNRTITGAIVRRQPFGGWKRSAVGPGAKAGGPNYLLTLGRWRPAPDRATSGAAGTESPRAPVVALLDAVTDLLDPDALASLRRAVALDAAAWAGEFGTARDVSGIDGEHNVLRYRPIPVGVRQSPGVPLAALVRVCAAGLAAGGRFDVSVDSTLPSALDAALRRLGVTARVEDTQAWAARLAAGRPARVRVLGADGDALTRATGGAPEIAVYDGPVTEAGRIELLPFVHEQAISITAHRFGTHNPLTDGLV